MTIIILMTLYSRLYLGNVFYFIFYVAHTQYTSCGDFPALLVMEDLCELLQENTDTLVEPLTFRRLAD
jgi:hypothetical protein